MFIVGSTFAVRDRPPRFDAQRAVGLGRTVRNRFLASRVCAWGAIPIAVFSLICVQQN
jgi:hypothetical protein